MCSRVDVGVRVGGCVFESGCGWECEYEDKY